MIFHMLIVEVKTILKYPLAVFIQIDVMMNF